MVFGNVRSFEPSFQEIHRKLSSERFITTGGHIMIKQKTKKCHMFFGCFYVLYRQFFVKTTYQILMKSLLMKQFLQTKNAFDNNLFQFDNLVITNAYLTTSEIRKKGHWCLIPSDCRFFNLFIYLLIFLLKKNVSPLKILKSGRSGLYGRCF